MSKLADLLEANVAEIERRFLDRAYANTTSTSLDERIVLDRLGRFITETAAQLRSDDARERPGGQAPASPAATQHGKERFDRGYDLGALVREYEMLADVVLQIADEHGIDRGELRALSKYLIGGIADAAAEYGRQRDELLGHQAAEHLGFLAHELRNPLFAAAQTFALMLRKGEVQPGPSSSAMERSLATLRDLIDRALVDVRFRETPAPDLEPLRLDELINLLAEQLHAAIAHRQQHLVAVGVDVALRADRKLLTSALSNLIGNAIKFSRDGATITVRGTVTGEHVRVEVEDECGGLPPGKVQELFTPFVQGEGDRSGFGLGLAIARTAARAHRGELRVHDLPGKGCVFALDLPLDPEPLIAEAES